ncbi:unnamed protein product [Peniophora sp. CBMAI 1063]|nr:unnamed protein product [Peniophora sp. CBMAI 1063]
MSESVPFVSTPTHPPAQGSLMHWAQSRLNSIYDEAAEVDARKVGGSTADVSDAFDYAFAKGAHIMLNMRPSNVDRLRARMRKQRGDATRMVQEWYGSLEVVDEGCAEERPTGLFTGFRHVTRVYEEREGYTPVVHQLWSTVQIRVAENPSERHQGVSRKEDSRRIVEFWETEIDTQEMAERSGMGMKDAEGQKNT